MALINCPECQKQVSEHSINCPNCGYPINQLEKKTVVKGEGCFLQTLNLGCLIFSIIIGLAILFSLVMAGGSFFKHFKKNEAKKIEQKKRATEVAPKHKCFFLTQI